MLAVLSRELISGGSNLPKELSRLGICLEYKQSYFDEFQFRVVDIRNDLGDGVILG